MSSYTFLGVLGDLGLVILVEDVGFEVFGALVSGFAAFTGVVPVFGFAKLLILLDVVLYLEDAFGAES